MVAKQRCSVRIPTVTLKLFFIKDMKYIKNGIRVTIIHSEVSLSLVDVCSVLTIMVNWAMSASETFMWSRIFRIPLG